MRGLCKEMRELLVDCKRVQVTNQECKLSQDLHGEGTFFAQCGLCPCWELHSLYVEDEDGE